MGPDLLAPTSTPPTRVRRCAIPSRADDPIGEALVDQRALAGIGNVYKSEVLWLERVAPSALVADLDDATLTRLVATARRLLLANADRGAGPERVTTGTDRRRSGRSTSTAEPGVPAGAAATPISSARQGRELPRTTYWCPTCQPVEALASAEHV